MSTRKEISNYLSRSGNSKKPYQRAAGLHTFQRWQLSARRNNQQLLTNKPPLGPVIQVVHHGRIRFGDNLLDGVDLQRPDGVGCASSAPFQLQVSHMCLWREFLFVHPHWPHIWRGGLGEDGFLFDCILRFLASEPGHFIVQCGDDIWQSFDPGSRPARGEIHFNGILVPKQPFSKGAVESLHNCLALWMSVRPRRMAVLLFSMAFVTAPMNLRPGSTCSSCGHFKGPRLYIFAKPLETSSDSFEVRGFCSLISAGHIHNCKGVFVNLFPMWELVMGQK